MNPTFWPQDFNENSQLTSLFTKENIVFNSPIAYIKAFGTSELSNELLCIAEPLNTIYLPCQTILLTLDLHKLTMQKTPVDLAYIRPETTVLDNNFLVYKEGSANLVFLRYTNGQFKGYKYYNVAQKVSALALDYASKKLAITCNKKINFVFDLIQNTILSALVLDNSKFVALKEPYLVVGSDNVTSPQDNVMIFQSITNGNFSQYPRTLSLPPIFTHDTQLVYATKEGVWVGNQQVSEAEVLKISYNNPWLVLIAAMVADSKENNKKKDILKIYNTAELSISNDIDIPDGIKFLDVTPTGKILLLYPTYTLVGKQLIETGALLNILEPQSFTWHRLQNPDNSSLDVSFDPDIFINKNVLD